MDVSFNKNRVEDIGDAQPIVSAYQKSEEGEPLHQFYGYIMEGIFQSDAEAASFTYIDDEGNTQRTYPNAKAGDVKFKDLNGDGMLNDEDRDYIGSLYPEFIYGFTNTFSYKGFDLNIFLQGSYGNDILYLSGTILEGMLDNFNQSTSVLERWTPDNPSTTIPRAVKGDPNLNSRANSSRWIKDGSYLRVKDVTLSYTFQSGVFSRFGLSSARVFVNLSNWFTFTKDYPGFDPEIAGGIDQMIYPISKSYNFGLSIDF